MNLKVHLNTSESLLENYSGNVPFAGYLKSYFKENKKHGSTDRRNISTFCYAYFRTGKAFQQLPKKEKMAAGLFLTSTEPNQLLGFLHPQWNELLPLSRNQKIDHLKNVHPGFSESTMFPNDDVISTSISKTEFILSHLQQRNVFIRARPGKEQKVNKILREHSIGFDRLNANCFSLPPGFKIEKYFTLDSEIVVQDYSSQQTGDLFSRMKMSDNPAVWDCCAASGGKSILAYDKIPKVKLTVSDIRESILVNLKKRFSIAGISNYRSLVADVQKQSVSSFEKNFDCIIADVPCSGSGTWGRSPEQLYHFDVKKIEQYAALQKRVVTNIAGALKPDGYILYITCSVYKQENEEVVKYMIEDLDLQLLEQNIIEGYDKNADTMFAALLQLN